MLTVLKIIGIIAVVALVVAVLAVRWFLRRMKSFIAENTPVPCRINPEPEPNPQWRHAAVIPRIAEQFRDAGFTEIGAFNIPEMAGIQFLAFFHPQEQFYGCVYDHAKLEPTFDIVCKLTDDTAVTGTNTRLGEALDQRPGRFSVRLEKATVAEIFQAVRQHPAAAKPRKPAVPEKFTEYFRQAHTEYMNWRLSKGGTSREEISRQAAQDGQEVSAEVIEETYQTMRDTYVEELKDGCIAQYLDDARISAANFESRQTSLLAVPETLVLKEVIATLSEGLNLDDEQRHQLEQVESSFGQSGIEILANILERNVGALGLKKIGEVQEPVRAWILEVPPALDWNSRAGAGVSHPEKLAP
jgi:hypothetical protein